MKKVDLINDIAATYQKHGWELKGALLRADTLAELTSVKHVLAELRIQESPIDALWFSRPSHSGGEAWELRLVSETPFALFERIEPNGSEERRSEIFQSMEDRLCQYVSGP